MVFSLAIVGISCNLLVAFEESVLSKIILANLWTSVLSNVGEIAARVDSVLSCSYWAIPGNDVAELSCESNLELSVWSLTLPNHSGELVGNKWWATKTSLEIISGL